MGSQASKGGVAVEGKAAAADPAAVKTNGQVGTGSSVTIHAVMGRHTHIQAKRAPFSAPGITQLLADRVPKSVLEPSLYGIVIL